MNLILESEQENLGNFLRWAGTKLSLVKHHVGKLIRLELGDNEIIFQTESGTQYQAGA